MVVRLNRPETTLVASIGICFAVALLAHSFGYSVALGAFIAGSLVAESGEEKSIEHLVQPVRDVFAAIFFVSVGMMIDPALVAQHWIPVLVFTVAVILGQVVVVTIGAFLTGFGTRTSMQAGMSLAQIGEFSFIIAGRRHCHRRDARLSVSGRGGGLGHDDADDAVADPRGRARPRSWTASCRVPSRRS